MYKIFNRFKNQIFGLLAAACLSVMIITVLELKGQEHPYIFILIFFLATLGFVKSVITIIKKL